MAYSFVQIEKEKSRSIVVLIAILIAIYFFTAWIIYFIVKSYFLAKVNEQLGRFFIFPSLTETVVVFAAASAAALVHFYATTAGMMLRAIQVLDAKPLDLNYPPHKMLKNIIEEVSTAMGGLPIGGCVVNTASCNAFSIGDFKSIPYIGVTEGLLSKLNRSQLEAVIGHEAAHIARGDTLIVTTTCSIFGLYEGMMVGIKEGLFRIRGGVALVGVLIYLILQLVHFFNKLLVSSISQQKEFRADAVAVRLTRDPLSLAQSLYIISKRWHGESTKIVGLSSLFIVEPAVSGLSGFSTHPPIEERINILLNMAHADKSALETMLVDVKPQIKAAHDSFLNKAKKEKLLKNHQGWFVFKENQWQGPFLFVELAGLGWLKADSLIRRDGAIEAKPAYQDSRLIPLFKPHQQDLHSRYSCPHCYHGLEEIGYEGAVVDKCSLCKGFLLTRDELNKVLIREDRDFSKSIIAQAEIALAEKKERFKQIRQIKTPLVINCPNCSRKMMRKLYSFYAPVEVDECGFCGRVWFDQDELEIVQAIYDRLPNKDQIVR
ncbi:MAG: M48 family metalloprotease [Candidatus Omnitrophica bacterium]|nr:M48 family metalloprotease [Candidatus Omnitrophota bacterium]MBU2043686.1 M48 family metalloprotease [Candidatus Omnitrophota bacterium]MBU2250720.1 M48 family metalloprotease [Candidatus Omnitrophota bacterium]MBU2265737.1 M48 family metalloprotease [Candidatus Omnitrophota bacterium]MBU2474168.1 M48 family metalloprotease [Candidatus Omnitrophota bacterium]